MLAVCVLSGCTLDASRKTACADDEDCIGGHACVLGRCLADPVWGCLDGEAKGGGINGSRSIVLHLTDELTDAVVPGAQVRVCTRPDVTCLQPLTTVVSDADGAVALELEDQFVEITADGYMPALAMSADSFELADDGVTLLFDLWSLAGWSGSAAQAGITLEAQRGTIDVSTRDCGLEQAGDVTVSVDVMEAPAVVRYPINDVLSTTAVATDFETATALVFNAEPGSRSVSGEVLTRDRPLGGTRSVLVRPGWLSSVTLAPDGLTIYDLLSP